MTDNAIEQSQDTFKENIARYNRLEGYHMKHCTNCGVGVGLMTRKDYELGSYKDALGECQRCGTPIHIGA